MKLGIYMGSFNPPHKGHLKVVNYLLKNRYVEKVIIVPTLNYWDKTDLVDIKDRINMLKYYENDNIIIDIKHNQYIYTYQLVKKLEKQYSNDELFVIMGADNIINLDKWKDYQKLLKYPIIVMNRNNIDIKKYLSRLKGKFIVVDDYPYIDISSSEIRKMISNKYLDDDVFNYIKKNGLYQKEDMHHQLLSNLSKIHTTKLGINRIKKNLKLASDDVVNYLKDKIIDKRCIIYQKGKNYYCNIDSIIITINSYNYCIITAHIKRGDKNE